MTSNLSEILSQVLWSVETISNRFKPITSPQDFSSSDAGLEKLDAICIQLIESSVKSGPWWMNLDRITVVHWV